MCLQIPGCWWRRLCSAAAASTLAPCRLLPCCSSLKGDASRRYRGVQQTLLGICLKDWQNESAQSPDNFQCSHLWQGANDYLDVKEHEEPLLDYVN